MLIFNQALVPDRRSCRMKERQWGEPCITLKHTSCVHFLNVEGRSGSVIMVRGSDLPLNKDALSGSQNSPNEVKVSPQTCEENLWLGMKFASLLASQGAQGCTAFLVHIQQGVYDNSNGEPDMIAEVNCKALCNDAMRWVLPNPVLSYLVRVPRCRGRAGPL